MNVIEIEMSDWLLHLAHRRLVEKPAKRIDHQTYFERLLGHLVDLHEEHYGHRPVNFAAPRFWPVSAIFHLQVQEAVLVKLRSPEVAIPALTDVGRQRSS